MSRNFSEKAFKEVKEYVDAINIEAFHKHESFSDIVNELLSDKRKNIQGLGNKLLKGKEKIEAEIKRVKAMYDFDKEYAQGTFLAGVDEVGRGPLAGPIVACAVILDLNVADEELILGLNDSKKINEKKREELAEIIKNKAVAYCISESSNDEIDEKGIAFSNNKVFIMSCHGLSQKPDIVLSDGYLIKNFNIKNQSVIKGDTKSASIAAASILAKVYRDNLMKEYGKLYPQYGFDENAGYGTPKHVEGIKEHGATEIHRMTFLKNIL